MSLFGLDNCIVYFVSSTDCYCGYEFGALYKCRGNMPTRFISTLKGLADCLSKGIVTAIFTTSAYRYVFTESWKFQDAICVQLVNQGFTLEAEAN